MSKLVHNYNGGTTDQYGTFLALSRFLTGDVIEGLKVVANGTPNMTVVVQNGSGRIGTGTYPSNYSFFVSVDTSGGESVTIGTSAASPRIDYIVAYIDLAVSGSTSPTYVNNTNAVLKFADVQGTPAGSPVVPTVSQIQTAIGASNPYVIYAQVAVAASATSITNPNITDSRVFIRPTNGVGLSLSSYIDSGCVWSIVSGLNGTMTAGVVYINVAGVMLPVSVATIASHTFTASKDTYISVDITGTITYQETTNGGTAPTLPANSVWLYIGISGASALSGFDSINLRSATGSIIARRKISVAGDTLSLQNIPPRQYLRLLVNVLSTGGATQLAFKFNNDSGANYAVRFSVNGAADGTTLSGNNITPTSSTASDHYIVANVLNIAAQEKRFNSIESEGVTGAATAPTRVEIMGKWANTSAQINRIDITNSGAGDMAVGSEIVVMGWD